MAQAGLQSRQRRLQEAPYADSFPFSFHVIFSVHPFLPFFTASVAHFFSYVLAMAGLEGMRTHMAARSLEMIPSKSLSEVAFGGYF